MADRLVADNTEESNLTQATFLEFVDRHDDVERELTSAQETVRSIRRQRKDLRKTIKAVGINLEAFDRHLKDVNRSGEEREAEDQQYRRYMIWREKPVGFQASMDLQTPDSDLAAVNVHTLHQIDNEGYDAGKGGSRRDVNPWTPGTEQAQRWDNAWLRGQETIAQTLVPDGANGATEPQSPRRRGRPPGSRNKAKEQPAAAE